MFLINDILISDEILEKKFCCNLSACHGACCVKGDYGAPLEPEEREVLKAIQSDVAPILDAESKETLAIQGVDTYYPGMNDYGTTLRPDGACVFVVMDENGIASCGIEKQYEADLINFKKPLSCELYPLRVTRHRETGFIALNFDKWSICKPAEDQGHQLGIPVVHFLRDALTRAFGEEFAEALDAAMEHHQRTKE